MTSVAATRVPIGGDIADVSLRAVLDRLGHDRATGILTVQSREDIIAVSFEAGLIVGADALNETLEKGLGRALKAEGLLTAEQLSSVRGRIRAEPARLDAILLEETSLSRADYLGALRHYTLDLVERGCSWDQGEYRFFAGDEVSSEEGLVPIRTDEVEGGARESFVEPLQTSPATALSVLDRELSEPAESRSYGVGAAKAPAEEVPPARIEPAVEEDIQQPRLGLGQRLLQRIGGVAEWPSWGLPSIAVILLAAVVLRAPNLLVYPSFWLEAERLEFQKLRRTTVYLKIDRAAKTYFLLEGRFPEDLHTLVALGLLSADDVVGSKGRLLTYVPDDRGYVIRSAVTDGTDPGMSQPEAITGDFFLDPEYVILAPETGSPPLVLLD